MCYAANGAPTLLADFEEDRPSADAALSRISSVRQRSAAIPICWRCNRRGSCAASAMTAPSSCARITGGGRCWLSSPASKQRIGYNEPDVAAPYPNTAARKLEHQHVVDTKSCALQRTFADMPRARRHSGSTSRFKLTKTTPPWKRNWSELDIPAGERQLSAYIRARAPASKIWRADIVGGLSLIQLAQEYEAAILFTGTAGEKAIIAPISLAKMNDKSCCHRWIDERRRVGRAIPPGAYGIWDPIAARCTSPRPCIRRRLRSLGPPIPLEFAPWGDPRAGKCRSHVPISLAAPAGSWIGAATSRLSSLRQGHHRGSGSGCGEAGYFTTEEVRQHRGHRGASQRLARTHHLERPGDPIGGCMSRRARRSRRH